MSPWLFISADLENRSINVFRHGEMQRDFTFIDDIVEATVKVVDIVTQSNSGYRAEYPDPSSSFAPYMVYNIGNYTLVGLMGFIETIGRGLGKEAIKNYLPMQGGDVLATCADVSVLKARINFEPKTRLRDGIAR